MTERDGDVYYRLIHLGDDKREDRRKMTSGEVEGGRATATHYLREGMNEGGGRDAGQDILDTTEEGSGLLLYKHIQQREVALVRYGEATL